MIIYNVTIKTDWSIAEAWLVWMRNEHIPEVMQCGCFVKYQLVKLLETDEADGPTYAVQYFADTADNYQGYIQHYAPLLRQKSFDKWGNHFIAFRSLMEVL